MKRALLVAFAVLLTTAAAAWASSPPLAARSAGEALPRGVREIDVSVGYPKHAPKVSLHVRSATKVRRIVRWFDGLETVQPGVRACPDIAIAAGEATFSFRAAHGTLLALARMSALTGKATECSPIELSIRGRPQKPRVGGFLSRVQRLLGVRLILPPPTLR